MADEEAAGAGRACTALLRGVNVGRAKQLPMADFRALLAGLGFGAVRTHLRSGNAVFTADRAAGAAELAARIEAAIAERFGFGCGVVVREAAELAAVVRHNPLPQAADDGSRLVVGFLSEEPAAQWVAEAERLAPGYADTEPFAVRGREVYVWHRAGISRSTLPKDFWGSRMGVRVVTVRNWNTVTALAALAAEAERTGPA